MYIFSNKVRIFYLCAIILFCLGIFFYLLDSWQILNLENYLPGLSQQASLVAEDKEGPSELEWKRLEKEQKRLSEQRLKLEEELSQLREKNAELSSKEEELQKKIDGFQKEQEAFATARQNYQEEQQSIRNMGARLRAMPPQEAVAIIANWSNADLVSVFLEMERRAQLEGNQSIVPYLLTLMPRERAALVTTLMLDTKAQDE